MIQGAHVTKNMTYQIYESVFAELLHAYLWTWPELTFFTYTFSNDWHIFKQQFYLTTAKHSFAYTMHDL